VDIGCLPYPNTPSSTWMTNAATSASFEASRPCDIQHLDPMPANELAGPRRFCTAYDFQRAIHLWLTGYFRTRTNTPSRCRLAPSRA
jgi:hypothetical protein